MSLAGEDGASFSTSRESVNKYADKKDSVNSVQSEKAFIREQLQKDIGKNITRTLLNRGSIVVFTILDT